MRSIVRDKSTVVQLFEGQNIDRGPPDGSSSEFSEDDTPLAVRLNSQGSSRTNDAGKQRLRAALSKKGGFVIPRKKKQANELLQVSNFNAREGKEVLRNVVQSYRDTAVGATFKLEKLELVHNDQLSREFQDKKQHMRTDEGRNARELEDKFAFLYTVDRDEAKKICEVGLEVGSSSVSCLGDPSMGVYLCRHADVISKKPLLPGVPGYLIVFKVVKGKVKPVTERSAAVTDLLEPSPNFDCHVSRSIQSLPANSPLSLVFEYSQYYFYDFAEEGDDLHMKRARQCLPYAVLTFTMVGSSAAPQEPPGLQEEVPATDSNGFLPPVSYLLKQETNLSFTRYYRSGQRNGRSKDVSSCIQIQRAFM